MKPHCLSAAPSSTTSGRQHTGCAARRDSEGPHWQALTRLGTLGFVKGNGNTAVYRTHFQWLMILDLLLTLAVISKDSPFGLYTM